MNSITPLSSPVTIIEKLKSLGSLIKTRIMIWVVVATLLGFWGAENSLKLSMLIIATITGTALVCSGSGVLNNVLERNVDRKMKRTRDRVLPAGLVTPRSAIILGFSFVIVGIAILWQWAGIMPASLAILSALLYLLVYTPLKRISWINTSVGAIPGAIPPVIGWSASSGSLELGAWLLFALLFIWQHPHFYAIAWIYKDDYRVAGLRMASEIGTKGQFLAIQVIVFLIILMPVSFSLSAVGIGETWYIIGSTTLGLGYLIAGIRFARRRNPARARILLRASVLYLPLIVLVLSIDRALTKI